MLYFIQQANTVLIDCSYLQLRRPCEFPTLDGHAEEDIRSYWTLIPACAMLLLLGYRRDMFAFSSLLGSLPVPRL